ncbi:MAG: hypothetical protein VX610_00105 [SAR324 cluster bacterium]|nr:hypothetical protein [SAR324 cluster bacterium]
MLDNFDPKEKKAILVFIALLILGVVYVSTHNLPWDTPALQPLGGSEAVVPEPVKRSYETYF